MALNEINGILVVVNFGKWWNGRTHSPGGYREHNGHKVEYSMAENSKACSVLRAFLVFVALLCRLERLTFHLKFDDHVNPLKRDPPVITSEGVNYQPTLMPNR